MQTGFGGSLKILLTQAPTPLRGVKTAYEGRGAMTLEFTVGINIAGSRRTVTVSAEDALIAALKVKQRQPQATINYVRRSNRRGDQRHPHESVVADA